jgi:hypothetical protein
VANELKIEGRLDLGNSDKLSLPHSASDPGSAAEGDMYYNTGSKVVRIYQNAVWQNMIASVTSAALLAVEPFTLSSGDISNKFITLSAAPTAPTKTQLSVIGGPAQAYGTDFTVTGTQLSWSGLFLDGVLVAGDIVTVQYE